VVLAITQRRVEQVVAIPYFQRLHLAVVAAQPVGLAVTLFPVVLVVVEPVIQV
jgi:hypothetical protein